MVSLEEQIKIDKSLGESPKAYALFCLLTNQNIITPNEGLGETDEIYYSVLASLKSNNSKTFKEKYEELSKRQVLNEQPIIYDNYLLFILIIGVVKFNLNKQWLTTIMSLRVTQNDPERSITISFSNLLNSNYLTTDGIPSIILAALSTNDNSNLSQAIVKNSFEGNKKVMQYLERDLFLASIYLYCNDYIISVSIGEDSIKLKKFEGVFLKRVVLLQNVVYLMGLFCIIVLCFFLINRYPVLKEYSNTLEVILGIIGIGLLAMPLNKVKDQLGRLIKQFFGYK